MARTQPRLGIRKYYGSQDPRMVWEESGRGGLHHAVIPALKGLKQEDGGELEASLSYAAACWALG